MLMDGPDAACTRIFKHILTRTDQKITHIYSMIVQTDFRAYVSCFDSLVLEICSDGRPG
jgi:hypothetical protein